MRNFYFPVSKASIFSFVFFIIFINVPIITLRSWSSDLNSFSEMVSELYNNSNQYSVSEDSLRAIDNLLIKSALLWAFLLSAMLAPILVPARYTCFDMIYSFLSIKRYLYSFIMRRANCLLNSAIKLSFSIINFSFSHYLNFSIMSHFLIISISQFQRVNAFTL